MHRAPVTLDMMSALSQPMSISAPKNESKHEYQEYEKYG